MAENERNGKLAGDAEAQRKQCPYAVISAESNVALNQAFIRKSGWTGADGCYSAPLDKEKCLWMFGDTWIGDIDAGGHKNATMINNTAAWQDRRAPYAVQFFWQKGTSNEPRALFRPSDSPASWYWPGALIKLGDNTLLHFLKRVRTLKHGPPAFSFEWFADDLAVITNSSDRPDRFSQRIFPLPEFNGKILAGVAGIVYGDDLYVYCSAKELASGMNAHPSVIARVPVKDIASGNATRWQIYCRQGVSGSDGVWTIGQRQWLERPENPVVMFDDAAPEMSVTPFDDGFVAVYNPPMSPSIFMRYAARPWGPWSQPLMLYKCPEGDLKVNGKSVFVYAAKAHLEFSDGCDELIISYSANPGDIAEHNARPDLYFPKFIKVKLGRLPTTVGPGP